MPIWHSRVSVLGRLLLFCEVPRGHKERGKDVSKVDLELLESGPALGPPYRW